MKGFEGSRFSVVLSVVLMLAGALVAQAQEASPPGRLLKGHKGSVLDVAFTHDGKTLVSSSRDATIKIWDVATGELKDTLTNHTKDVYTVAFSNSGDLMASGSTDTTIIIWDAKTYKPIRTLTGHTAAIREAEFSPDDKTLASVGEDSTFRLWDVETGNLKVTRDEHKNTDKPMSKVKSVSYYPDGKTILTVSHDWTARLWDASGEPKKVLKGHKDVLEDGAVSPDGKQLLTGSGTDWGQLIFWDAQTGEMLKDLPEAHGNEHGKEIDSVGYTPDGKYAVSGAKDRTIKFWDPKTYELVHKIEGNPGRIESMTFSRDSKMMATGFGGSSREEETTKFIPYQIEIWDISEWVK